MIRPPAPRRRHCLLAATLAAAAGCGIRDRPPDSVAGRALTAAGPTADAPAGTITYVEGYESGSRRACEQKRPLLVVFKAAWCPWCGRLAEETLSDPRVVALSRRFVCTTVDADRNADDCRRFGVREFPTVVVSAAGGTGAERRLTGCTTPEELAAALEAVLDAPRVAAEADGRDGTIVR